LLPFEDRSFDLVYSNGVLHHTPNTSAVVREILRVLRPGGRAIVMLYAEHSLHYWRKLVWRLGMKDGLLARMSMGEIMSRTVERSANEARPLVKVYSPARAAALFKEFAQVEIVQRQLEPGELPKSLRWALPFIERRWGWNLIIKADKSRNAG
jgi:SAM-dependent methyltransferase